MGSDKMAHVVVEKQKLLNRVRRLRGQVDAIERALDADEGCTEVMRLLTAVRGAINGIMAEVVEDHIHMHMIDENRKPTRAETDAADELIDVLRSYIK
jgi:DNA-binding FrmR family transcriptional regulator